MAYPFFSLAKSKRLAPIDFKAGAVAIRVEAVPEHGMATIWDADVLIWAASQIVEARDHGLRTSRLMAATPYEILTFVGRGTSVARLRAPEGRTRPTAGDQHRHQHPPTHRAPPAPLQLDQRVEGNGRRARAADRGRADRARLVLCRRPRRRARADHRPRLFRSNRRGLERWLYRLVRKHGGRQVGGWSFDVAHLHLKSGSLSPLKHFRLRPARHRQTPGAARLRPDARTRFRARPARLSAARHRPAGAKHSAPHARRAVWG